MKQEQITSLENKIKKEYGNITGIIVLKDNNAAYESYFNETDINPPAELGRLADASGDKRSTRI